ncbi:hypothetical protein E2562_021468 [Oryza meyeriana var. granulata]|uniref:Strictosidine synthase conserved region domain-containing protein n=1 Tax=Oryza meyeriana var. granulata TaxID=110450 RepID=A0A6G1E1H6_9ORYZ|nr:hypothetical protein E2562_021468 [Oryza meyeriana var. granulata]
MFFLLLSLASLLISPCTAQQIKTIDTRWTYHLPLPDGISGAESLAFDGKDGLYTGVSDGRVLKCDGNATG